MSPHSTDPRQEPVCFVFVCQRGVLEAQALLLAASLRRFMPSWHDVVAAVPGPTEQWGTPAPSTLVALDRYGVRRAAIVNRVSPDYPIGNKIDCLAIPTTCGRIVFLDTDILMLRAAPITNLAPGRIAAVAASATHVALEDWFRFYAACGVSNPRASMRTLVSGELTPPYFNSGVLAVDATIAPELADVWSECALKLLSLDNLPNPVRYRFLDQVALPIAAAKLGQRIEPLASDWNFPSWSWSLADRPCPAFYHYQQLCRLLENGPARGIFAALVAADDLIAEAILATMPGTSDDDVN